MPLPDGTFNELIFVCACTIEVSIVLLGDFKTRDMPRDKQQLVYVSFCVK